MDESITFIRRRPSAAQNSFTAVPSPNPLIFSPNLLLHMDGANGSQIFTDSSNGHHIVIAQGTAQISTAQFKFGSGSATFPAAGDALTLDSSSEFIFGTGDFTLDCWVQIFTDGFEHILLDFRGTGVPGPVLVIDLTDHVQWFDGVAVQIDSGSVVLTQDGLFHHVAVTRNSSKTRMFIDGFQVGSTFIDTNNYTVGSPDRPVVGAGQDGLGGYATQLNGFLDEVRIIKGYAAWISNFIPPTSPYNPP